MLNHINMLMSYGRQIICQYLVLFTLAVVIIKLATKMSWSDLGLLFHKKAMIVVGVMAIVYVVFPLWMIAFVSNVISIMAFITLIIVFIGDIGKWLSKLPGAIGGSFRLWIEVLNNPVRLVCFTICCWYFAKGSILDFVVVVLFLGVGTNLLIEKFGADKIDWDSKTTQTIATIICILPTISSIILFIGSLGLIGKIISIFLIIVLVALGIYGLVRLMLYVDDNR